MNQLILLRPNPRHIFDTFYSPTDSAAVTALKEADRHATFWLHGSSGSGKTHLLQAVCQNAEQQGQTAAYMPAPELQELGPQILQGLEQCHWICLDGIEPVLGKPEWEQELFALFNQAIDHGTRLLFSAHVPPMQAQTVLPDLKSRLCGMVPLTLPVLDDEQQVDALQLRARNQGYELEAQAIHYIQRHKARGMESLCQLLDRVEERAQREKRKITIPFLSQHG